MNALKQEEDTGKGSGLDMLTEGDLRPVFLPQRSEV